VPALSLNATTTLPTDLPECHDWRSIVHKGIGSNANRTYFWNTRNNVTDWQKPPIASRSANLPEGWSRQYNVLVEKQQEQQLLPKQGDEEQAGSQSRPSTTSSATSAASSPQAGAQVKRWRAPFYRFGDNCFQHEKPLPLDRGWTYEWNANAKSLYFQRIAAIEEPAPYDLSLSGGSSTSTTSSELPGASATGNDESLKISLETVEAALCPSRDGRDVFSATTACTSSDDGAGASTPTAAAGTSSIAGASVAATSSTTAGADYRSLPRCHPWRKVATAKGKPYYWNTLTKQTQWQPPVPKVPSNEGKKLPDGWRRRRKSAAVPASSSSARSTDHQEKEVTGDGVGAIDWELDDMDADGDSEETIEDDGDGKQGHKKNVETESDDIYFVLRDACWQSERPVPLVSPWVYQYEPSRKQIYYQQVVRRWWPVPRALELEGAAAPSQTAEPLGDEITEIDSEIFSPQNGGGSHDANKQRDGNEEEDQEQRDPGSNMMTRKLKEVLESEVAPGIAPPDFVMLPGEQLPGHEQHDELLALIPRPTPSSPATRSSAASAAWSDANQLLAADAGFDGQHHSQERTAAGLNAIFTWLFGSFLNGSTPSSAQVGAVLFALLVLCIVLSKVARAGVVTKRRGGGRETQRELDNNTNASVPLLLQDEHLKRVVQSVLEEIHGKETVGGAVAGTSRQEKNTTTNTSSVEQLQLQEHEKMALPPLVEQLESVPLPAPRESESDLKPGKISCTSLLGDQELEAFAVRDEAAPAANARVIVEVDATASKQLLRTGAMIDEVHPAADVIQLEATPLVRRDKITEEVAEKTYTTAPASSTSRCLLPKPSYGIGTATGRGPAAAAAPTTAPAADDTFFGSPTRLRTTRKRSDEEIKNEQECVQFFCMSPVSEEDASPLLDEDEEDRRASVTTPEPRRPSELCTSSATRMCASGPRSNNLQVQRNSVADPSRNLVSTRPRDKRRITMA